MLASLEYAKPLQVETELSQLAQILACQDITSYLEVGVRYGGSFETIMSALPYGSRGFAVDFPGGNFGDDGSVPIFLAAVNRLREKGYLINYVFGPSQSQEVLGRASIYAPYDAVLIDGDHSYEAVKRDFRMYSALAKIVILHDIAAPPDVRSKNGLPVEVPRFWNEVKSDYRHLEIIAPGTNMGIGVIWK